MSEFNKSYRIKANVGDGNDILIDTNIVQDYDTLDILSLNIKSVDTYRIHNSNYGVVVGRVLANNGFGVPNAKLSIFIEVDSNEGELVRELYPFSNPYSTDINDVRYNLLPDEAVDVCHQVVGTFPNKSYMLDNDVVLEVFDKYYKYTTRTNHAGDYLIMGVPVGMHTLHMDLDLSDCGALSQRPRDFIYKGYSIEQFETPTKFKSGTNYQELSQVFSQDKVITVIPFWGDGATGESIGLTRADVNVAFKFEPTCVFIGSVVSDNSSNGITKKCRATENMGNMEEMVTGEGTIEMIRKTPSGDIESFAIKGNQLINGDGVWCYQIPMNLDYVMTDEFGNTVPTDDPQKGIPTRTSVRFRISMQDNEENLDNFFRCKVLVPHNPQFKEDGFVGEYDYEFGTYTNEESFRDLFWDNVYTVKSYIPRFQKRKVMGWKDKYFTGIKNCNFYGNNNPIPYNNIRIKLPLMFTIVCGLIKALIFITKISNLVMAFVGYSVGEFARKLSLKKLFNRLKNLKLNVITEGLCPDLENWYFAPITSVDLSDTVIKPDRDSWGEYNILKQTLNYVGSDEGKLGPNDEQSNDYQNKDENENAVCLTTKQDYLIACIEMNLAMEYRVINFDFYNDWINGMIYVPRFMRYVKAKKTVGKKTIKKAKIKGCMDNTSIYSTTRRYVQQCALGFKPIIEGGYTLYSEADNPLSTKQDDSTIRKSNKFHKKSGFNEFTIFGDNGGICHEHQTSRKQHVYYMKPCEWNGGVKVNLYATDIVLLGSLKPCNENGLPQAYKYLSSTSYIMPPNLALTNMENNGPIYVNDKNTICTGSNNQVTLDINKDKGVQMAPMGDLSTDELELYKNTGNPDIDTQFGGNELSDIIPVTEMAGISWNYTGPAQGEINEKQMYYPGGHFLGISCVNSQTNIKSCINLSRICEVGTTMSQRKEDIVNVDGDDVKYIYTSPTGFISGNDINGEDFRTMFATMNHKCLKATKLNLETGYKYYDLEFVKPISFNGAFGNVAKMSKASYNNTIKLSAPDEEKLKEYGIGLGNNYDPNEVFNTQTRTIEDASVDYYRFRLGLDYEDLNKRSFIHNSKFLLNEAGKKYLPQYENSYYFYFGLKAGATAIDEFNKLFYSTCENNVSTYHVPEINIIINDINLSEQTGDVTIVVDNVDLPLQQIILTINDEKRNITEDFKNNYVIKDGIFENLAFGNYYIEIVDFNGIQLGKSFKIGTDLFSLQKIVHDFNVNDALDHISTKNIFRGGFVEITDVNVNEYYKDSIEDDVKVILKPVGRTDIFSGTTTLNTNESLNIYVNEANIDYEIYLQYKIKESNNYSAEVYIDKFSIKDGSSVYLAMGWPTLPFYEKITTSSANTSTILTPFGDELERTKVPLILGGEKWWENEDLDDDNGIIGNWLKRVSIYKTTDEETLFSNNVFAVNGRKVIWGVPQNYKGIYNKNGIFCSEVLTTEYAGYSLDDEASYYGTQDGKHYSAIAIKDNLVSGDYFAILNNGRLIINNTCKGYFPNNNTGYVFKSLPDEELYFYVYNTGEGLVKPEKNGVYYASFEYPVIEKPFNAEVDFYIWGKPSIKFDASSTVYEYKELGGRTEGEIRGGIRYNGKLGLMDDKGDVVSGFSVTNIPTNVLEKKNDGNDTIVFSGMSVTTYEGDTPITTIRYRNGSTNKGVITYTLDNTTPEASVSYDISEGYPSGHSAFSTLIQSFQKTQSFENYFSDNIKYRFFPGRGFDMIGYKGEDINRIENGEICIFNSATTSSGNTLIVLPSSNDKYIYYSEDYGEKQPKYWILCKTKNSPDRLGHIYIYFTNKKNQFRVQVSYYSEDYGAYVTAQINDDIGVGDSYVRKNCKHNIENLLNYAKNNNKRKFEWNKYVTPIYNYGINCDVAKWKDQIYEDSKNYKKLLTSLIGTSGLTESKISGQTFYYVEKYEDNIYKIFPIITNEAPLEDDISLNLYYIKKTHNGGEQVLELTYKIDKVEYEGDDSNDYSNVTFASTSGEALSRLSYSIGGFTGNLNEEGQELVISGNSLWYGITIGSGSVSASTENIGGESGETFIVKYNIKVNVKGNKNDEMGQKASIYFFITSINNGIRLDIERRPFRHIAPFISYRQEDTFGESSLTTFDKYYEANKSNELVQDLKNKLGLNQDDVYVYDVDSNGKTSDTLYALYRGGSKEYLIGSGSTLPGWLKRCELINVPQRTYEVVDGSYVENYIENAVKIGINKETSNGGYYIYEISNSLNQYKPTEENIGFIRHSSRLVVIKKPTKNTFIVNGSDSESVIILPWVYNENNIMLSIEHTFEGIDNGEFFSGATFDWEVKGAKWNYELDVNSIKKDGKIYIPIKVVNSESDYYYYVNNGNWVACDCVSSNTLTITYSGISKTVRFETRPELMFNLYNNTDKAISINSTMEYSEDAGADLTYSIEIGSGKTEAVIPLLSSLYASNNEALEVDLKLLDNDWNPIEKIYNEDAGYYYITGEDDRKITVIDGRQYNKLFIAPNINTPDKIDLYKGTEKGSAPLDSLILNENKAIVLEKHCFDPIKFDRLPINYKIEVFLTTHSGEEIQDDNLEDTVTFSQGGVKRSLLTYYLNRGNMNSFQSLGYSYQITSKNDLTISINQSNTVGHAIYTYDVLIVKGEAVPTDGKFSYNDNDIIYEGNDNYNEFELKIDNLYRANPFLGVKIIFIGKYDGIIE